MVVNSQYRPVLDDLFSTGWSAATATPGALATDGAGTSFAGAEVSPTSGFALYCTAKPLWGLAIGRAEQAHPGLVDADLGELADDLGATLARVTLGDLLHYHVGFQELGAVMSGMLGPDHILEVATATAADLPDGTSSYSDLTPWIVADAVVTLSTGKSLLSWSHDVVVALDVEGSLAPDAYHFDGPVVLDGVMDPSETLPNYWITSSLARTQGAPSLGWVATPAAMATVMSAWSAVIGGHSAFASELIAPQHGTDTVFDMVLQRQVRWGIGVEGWNDPVFGNVVGHHGWGSSGLLFGTVEAELGCAWYTAGLLFEEELRRSREFEAVRTCQRLSAGVRDAVS